MDEAHLISALVYVDRNPARAGIVGDPVSFRWSSAKAHLSGSDRTGLVDFAEWQRIADLLDYGDLLYREENEETLERLRRHTLTGYPMGGLNILRLAEQAIGESLNFVKAGRPYKC